MPPSLTIERLTSLPTDVREQFLLSLAPSERRLLDIQLSQALGSPWGGYRYDPIGFVNETLGEPTWSKMQDILDSVLRYKITCVPAGHSVSKSHTAARVVAWWNTVHAPGTALTITTATTFQQVSTILWPHIRKMVARHGLPGYTNRTEWLIPTAEVDRYLTAYGFSSAENDEAAVQGRHAPHLLIVVDEAGGVSHTMGKALWSLLTGGHTRMLLIGNPSTEEENTWFQQRCESASRNTNVVPIPVFDTPNFTGEDAGICHSCPEGSEPHNAATHMVDKQWLREVTEEFGEGSPYLEARAYARFPTSVEDKVLPITWLEAVEQKLFPDDTPPRGRISLGCDIASDGGDEFVIARRVGMRAKVVHTSTGAANENSEDVGNRILVEIKKAEALHKLWGISEPVRVKIDAIGVGWGVVSYLVKRGEERAHNAEIVGVNVAETADDPEKFANKRAELWWTLRELVQPHMVPGPLGTDILSFDSPVRLDIDVKTLAQLAAPQYRSDGGGRIAIEKKDQIKKRTNGKSPDRGEAVLLAFYEPKDASFKPFAFTPVTYTAPDSGWRQVA